MADQASAIKNAMRQMMKRTEESPNSGERPPNLRQADDARESCATCEHFEEGRCRLYGYRVDGEQVCDSWTPLPEK